MKLLGEIITWSAGAAGIRVQRDTVIKALEDNKLDPKLAREIKHRTALMRVLREMETDQLVRIVFEDSSKVTVQLTGELLDPKKERLNYSYVSTVSLDKASGNITATSSPEDVAVLTKAIASRRQQYGALDISNMVQKLFRQKADLFSVRDQGGVYFVPAMHSDYVDSVQHFYESIGGKVNRFPVPDGNAHAKRSVKDTVTEGMREMTKDLQACISLVDADSRAATTERYAKRIKGLQFKLECYKEFLEGEASKIGASIKAARTLLAEKMTLLAASEKAGK